jgi:CRP/FNR family transcriptional regulator, nitrogen fixation regulation protein
LSDLANSLDQARHWFVRYHSRQLIYDEGEAANAIFRIREGCVRLQINGRNGHRQIVAFLFPGDVFGVCALERTSAAEAVTDTELVRYSMQSVLQLSAHSRELVVQLIQSANGQFNHPAHHVEHVAHLPAAERVLWFLTWLAHRQGRRTGETVRRDVGDFLALSPETLSRVMRELKAGGLVSPRGRRAFAIRQPLVELRAGAEAAGERPEESRQNYG